jgi:hypothetical protein
MGQCCVKQHNQDQGEFNDTSKSEGVISLFKNNQDAIAKIIKIQAHIRRFRASRKVKEIKATMKPKKMTDKENEATNGIPESQAEPIQERSAPPPNDAQNNAMDATSENSKVRELEVKLGPFKPPPQVEDGTKREKRETITLDNGARYTGEW